MFKKNKECEKCEALRKQVNNRNNEILHLENLLHEGLLKNIRKMDTIVLEDVRTGEKLKLSPAWFTLDKTLIDCHIDKNIKSQDGRTSITFREGYVLKIGW